MDQCTTPTYTPTFQPDNFAAYFPMLGQNYLLAKMLFASPRCLYSPPFPSYMLLIYYEAFMREKCLVHPCSLLLSGPVRCRYCRNCLACHPGRTKYCMLLLNMHKFPFCECRIRFCCHCSFAFTFAVYLPVQILKMLPKKNILSPIHVLTAYATWRTMLNAAENVQSGVSYNKKYDKGMCNAYHMKYAIFLPCHMKAVHHY